MLKLDKITLISMMKTIIQFASRDILHNLSFQQCTNVYAQ